MTARLPTHAELTNLYSRADVRACLGWSDEKLRRRLAKLPAVQPSGSGRGQQFTGADIWAIYKGGIACQPAGSKSTRRARSVAGLAGTSAAAICTADRSRAACRPRSRLQELLSDSDSEPSSGPTVVLLHPNRHP